MHGAPELVGADGNGDVDGYDGGRTTETTVDEIDGGKGGWFAYVRTRDFYIVLTLG